jgi:hypothetical protein
LYLLGLGIKLRRPLAARKLRFDTEGYLLIAAGDLSGGAGNIVKEVVFNPARYKVVGDPHPEVIIGKSQPGRVFEPDPVFLLPDFLRNRLIYGTNFVRERGLHLKSPNLSITAKNIIRSVDMITSVTTLTRIILAEFNSFNNLLAKFFSTTLRLRRLLQLRTKSFFFEQDLHSVNRFCGKPVDCSCNSLIKSTLQAGVFTRIAT